VNIGVIGSGNIGANAAKLFAAAGHRVVISNSRGPETLEGLVEEIGPGVRAATVEEAARTPAVEPRRTGAQEQHARQHPTGSWRGVSQAKAAGGG
jgi:NAD(P)-dependent dehydrogenase (short-subunit alcohol dehydrogenase family)